MARVGAGKRGVEPIATVGPVAISAKGREISDADRDKMAGLNGDAPFDAPFEAYKLRMAGVAWPEVAKKTGYGSGNSAAMAVSTYLQKAARNASVTHLAEALQMQVDRYEVILNEWWELGTKGHDEKAAAVLLRTLQQLERVQRLTDGDTVITRETLVISADPVEYVKQLQAAAKEREG